MDVVTLHLWQGPPGRRELRLSHLFPTTLENFFDDKATYEFKIFVGADNAVPQRDIKVTFGYDPESDELQVTPLSAVRYPWWRELRRKLCGKLCGEWRDA